MADDLEKPPSNLLVGLGNLLSQIPPTDPAILKKMEGDRLIRLHYAALGRVVATWSFYEAILDLWIWRLTNSSLAACVTAQLIAGPGHDLMPLFLSLRNLGHRQNGMMISKRLRKTLFV